MTSTTARARCLAALGLLLALATSCGTSTAQHRATGHPAHVRHVFVVNLENKGYDETFGAGSPAPYLSRTLAGKGVLLRQYFAVAHRSLPNYLAQISGQGPNPATQADCPTFSPFTATGTTSPGQVVGEGCLYPAEVPTIAGQLEAKGLTWRGYMEDMGTPCRHPAPGQPDDMREAKVGDQYAVRHDPFVYFRSISPRSCAQNVVDLDQLEGDLEQTSSTANLTYVTPNLCHDGHDAPCVDGRPGGLRSANSWLATWIPRILASPAFEKDGLLVVTFDEADTSGPEASTACCGETSAPNAPQPGIKGPGGGRIGTVLVSPFITAGTTSDTAYNHYSLLRSMEELFGLAPLGYAREAKPFGQDVWGAGD